MSEDLLALGLQHHRAGRLTEAESVYQQILKETPQHARALHLVGLIAHQSGRQDTAAEFIARAIAIEPNTASFHSNFGLVQLSGQRLEEAVESCERAIVLDPTHAAARNNLGLALTDLRRLDDAQRAFESALALKSDYIEAHNNLGMVLSSQGRLAQAVASYRAALSLNPRFAPAENNLGVCYWRMGEREKAKGAYRRAVEVDPGYAQAWSNLGVVLAEVSELSDSEKAFRVALELDPGNPEIRSALLLSLSYSATISPEELHAQHLRYETHCAGISDRAFHHENDRSPARKLRIGYVSPDFRAHSVACFIEEIFRAHDREKFEVYAYSDVAVPDDTTARLKTLVQCWRDIRGWSHAATAAAIQADRIDLLVDLAGHTGNNRLPVFARKPAPVQVTYLGYPGTTGLNAVHYRITDEWADPIGQTEQFHTEQLIRLSSGFLVYRPPSNVIETAPSRTQGSPIAFGSFNNIAKMNAAVISLWSVVLRAVPTSTLVLKSFGLKDREIQSRMSARFEANGISPRRIRILSPTDSVEAHLRLYDQIDIALDTFPYCGTTTTCEALWMGVPVITLAGRTHASRVGVSLLSRVGRPDLIAASPDDFVGIAKRLAGDQDALSGLRRTLRSQMQASSLMDAQRVTAALENAYCNMWIDWIASLQRT